MGMMKLSGTKMINTTSIQEIEVSYYPLYRYNESVSLLVLIELTLADSSVITIRNLLNDKIMLAYLKGAASFESNTSHTGIWLSNKHNKELQEVVLDSTSNELVPKIKEMVLGLFNTYMVSSGGHTDPDKMSFEEYLSFLHSSGMSTEYQEFYKAARALYNSVYEVLETTMEKLALDKFKLLHTGNIKAIEEYFAGSLDEEEKKRVAKEIEVRYKESDNHNREPLDENEEWEKIANMSDREAFHYCERRKRRNILNSRTEE